MWVWAQNKHSNLLRQLPLRAKLVNSSACSALSSQCGVVGKKRKNKVSDTESIKRRNTHLARLSPQWRLTSFPSYVFPFRQSQNGKIFLLALLFAEPEEGVIGNFKCQAGGPLFVGGCEATPQKLISAFCFSDYCYYPHLSVGAFGEWFEGRVCRPWDDTVWAFQIILQMPIPMYSFLKKINRKTQPLSLLFKIVANSADIRPTLDIPNY